MKQRVFIVLLAVVAVSALGVVRFYNSDESFKMKNNFERNFFHFGNVYKLSRTPGLNGQHWSRAWHAQNKRSPFFNENEDFNDSLDDMREKFFFNNFRGKRASSITLPSISKLSRNRQLVHKVPRNDEEEANKQIELFIIMTVHRVCVNVELNDDFKNQDVEL